MVQGASLRPALWEGFTGVSVALGYGSSYFLAGLEFGKITLNALCPGTGGKRHCEF